MLENFRNLVSVGDGIKNISNLQEKGLSYLSQEVFYCWQIWKQRISELTESRDCVMNHQGDCPPYLEKDVSLCEEWAGVSLQVSGNENYIINAINLENQDVTAWKGLTQVLTSESWRKANKMTEPWKSQGKAKRIHDDSKENKGEEPCRCNVYGENLVMKSTVEQHNVVQAVTKSFKYKNCVLVFLDVSDAHIHYSAHIGEKSCKCHRCGKDFSQSSDLVVHYKTHLGEKPYECHEWGKGCKQNSYLSRYQKSPSVSGKMAA
ncbi:zinc finger protein 285 isoform X2 [Choloepus didactylus]|nr:zinc finger protein 285 isoform X2 [Choloepus didactylus]XP_037675711.1 zinc finger protein 285 isoform X2 [Choloepus didactylus]XP_037675712.1 zinc finger protein 285 isoform X2 [Choloepus didactylus]